MTFDEEIAAARKRLYEAIERRVVRERIGVRLQAQAARRSIAQAVSWATVRR